MVASSNLAAGSGKFGKCLDSTNGLTMKYGIYRRDQNGMETYSLHPLNRSHPVFGDETLIHKFEVETSNEEALSKFYDYPTMPKAQGYFNEFLNYKEHVPERWDDMSDEEYGIVKQEVKEGRSICDSSIDKGT